MKILKGDFPIVAFSEQRQTVVKDAVTTMQWMIATMFVIGIG